MLIWFGVGVRTLWIIGVFLVVRAFFIDDFALSVVAALAGVAFGILGTRLDRVTDA